MTRYSVSGEVSPDCTIADTGEAAGQFKENDYWSWEAGGQTWFLFAISSIGQLDWYITTALGQRPMPPTFGAGSGYSKTLFMVAPADGDYVAAGGATGTVTVAEYVPPPDEYITVEWTASGKFTILKKST